MSPRPGRIIDVIENTLPTERPLEIRDSKEFITVSQRVRGLRSGHSYGMIFHFLFILKKEYYQFTQ